MEKVLAENVKRLCKEQKKQLKDLASEMGVDPASLNRAMYGNARLDTIEKMATALGVSIKSLFDPIDDNTVEGYIKIKGKIYQFNDINELNTSNYLDNMDLYGYYLNHKDGIYFENRGNSAELRAEIPYTIEGGVTAPDKEFVLIPGTKALFRAVIEKNPSGNSGVIIINGSNSFGEDYLTITPRDNIKSDENGVYTPKGVMAYNEYLFIIVGVDKDGRATKADYKFFHTFGNFDVIKNTDAKWAATKPQVTIGEDLISTFSYGEYYQGVELPKETAEYPMFATKKVTIKAAEGIKVYVRFMDDQVASAEKDEKTLMKRIELAMKNAKELTTVAELENNQSSVYWVTGEQTFNMAEFGTHINNYFYYRCWFLYRNFSFHFSFFFCFNSFHFYCFHFCFSSILFANTYYSIFLAKSQKPFSRLLHNLIMDIFTGQHHFI